MMPNPETQASVPDLGAEIILVGINPMVFTDVQSVRDCALEDREDVQCPGEAIAPCENGCLTHNLNSVVAGNMLVKQGDDFCTPWLIGDETERCWPEEHIYPIPTPRNSPKRQGRGSAPRMLI